MTIFSSFIIIPPSLFIKVMSLIGIVSSVNLGLSELKGKNVRYSKFMDAINSKGSGREIKVASKIGMLMTYTPALIVGVISFAIIGNSGSRCRLLTSMLILHFSKRVFEVLFIHRYSGVMLIDSVIVISFGYFISTMTMIYAQHLAHKEMVEPTLDLKYFGITLFFLGITGNFYHHYLLSSLRKKNDKEYKIPRRGLFHLVICPHYLFEIIELVGVAFISQTGYAFSFALGSMMYLMGRSYSTRKWYLSKFQNFPNEVRALIPYIF